MALSESSMREPSRNAGLVRYITPIEKALRRPEAAASLRYTLFALTGPKSGAAHNEPRKDDYVVRSEEHAVPQSRHRVFIVGIRADVASTMPSAARPRLEPRRSRVNAGQILAGMPRLRSGLSCDDSLDAWRRAVERARHLILDAQALRVYARGQSSRFCRIEGFFLMTNTASSGM